MVTFIIECAMENCTLKQLLRDPMLVASRKCVWPTGELKRYSHTYSCTCSYNLNNKLSSHINYVSIGIAFCVITIQSCRSWALSPPDICIYCRLEPYLCPFHLKYANRLDSIQKVFINRVNISLTGFLHLHTYEPIAILIISRYTIITSHKSYTTHGFTTDLQQICMFQFGTILFAGIIFEAFSKVVGIYSICFSLDQ